MTAVPSIDPEQFLHEQLAQASPDLMRQMLATFIQTLLSDRRITPTPNTTPQDLTGAGH